MVSFQNIYIYLTNVKSTYTNQNTQELMIIGYNFWATETIGIKKI